MQNYEDDAEQWRSKIVVDSSCIPLALDGDAWDDTEILEVFDAAIREHKTKASQKKNKVNDKQKDRNSRNVHFAEGEDVAPSESCAEAEGIILKGQWTEDPTSRDMGRPHVNFDLTATHIDSNTHTDNEGSDSGAGSQEYQESSDMYQSVPLTHPPPAQPPTHRPPLHPQVPASRAAPASSFCPLGSMPPAPPLGGGHIAEGTMESALSDMLMAWYQSGYTTGRYYTMLENQQQQWQQYYQQQALAQSGPQQQQQQRQSPLSPEYCPK